MKGEAASTDVEAAAGFPTVVYLLLKIINEGDYTKQQIFCVNETALYWKR